MKSKFFIWAGIGIAILLFLPGNSTAAASKIVLSDGTSIDFGSLASVYGTDNVQRLAKLLLAMQNKNLTALQTRLMLSQALVETGLFTDNPNYNLMDGNNNFAGISVNSRYPNSSNNYAQYPSLDAFVNDWILVLNNFNALDANGTQDFINRLYNNGVGGYFVTAGLPGYQNGIPSYYNLLS